jgi:hypothetical protein
MWKKTSLTNIAAPRFTDMAIEDKAPDQIIETRKKRKRRSGHELKLSAGERNLECTFRVRRGTRRVASCFTTLNIWDGILA